jgi:hypothetical protein
MGGPSNKGGKIENRGCEIGSDHYLIKAKLRIPPKWLKTITNV